MSRARMIGRAYAQLTATRHHQTSQQARLANRPQPSETDPQLLLFDDPQLRTSGRPNADQTEQPAEGEGVLPPGRGAREGGLAAERREHALSRHFKTSTEESPPGNDSCRWPHR